MRKLKNIISLIFTESNDIMLSGEWGKTSSYSLLSRYSQRRTAARIIIKRGGSTILKPWLIVLIVITVILVAAIIALYILGKKSQKKKEEQEAQIAAAAQTISMLVIDKKHMKLKDAGLPAAILEQTPKLLRRSKMPIVKAKVGPKIMTFICEESIFDSIPTKKEVKAVVSGLYITKVRGLRGAMEAPPKKSKFKQKLEQLKQQRSAK